MKIRVSVGLLIFGYILAVNANSNDTTEGDIVTNSTESGNVSSSTSITSTMFSPSVTTWPPTTPLPTPGPSKDPTKAKWVIKQGNNTCIILEAAIQIVVTYEQTNENIVKAYLNVPENAATEESSCEQNVLSLAFNDTSLFLEFVEESGKVFVKNANFTYDLNNDIIFPGAKAMDLNVTVYASNLTLFKASKGKSYLCKEESKINFIGNVTASFTDIQAEAFKNDTSNGFSTAEECSSDKISDIVPIAVGCALAALVIIVLIAYLVGRQRTRQRGYQSV